MSATCGCGVTLPADGRRHCAFCRRTILLIQRRQCVACGALVLDGDRGDRIEGRCDGCMHRNVRLGPATRHLLHQAAAVRSMRRRRAAGKVAA